MHRGPLLLLPGLQFPLLHAKEGRIQDKCIISAYELDLGLIRINYYNLACIEAIFVMVGNQVKRGSYADKHGSALA